MTTAKHKLGPEWPTEVDGFRLSELVGVSVRYLRDLKKRGVVSKGSRPGMYRYPESLHGYIAYQKEIVAETGALSPLTIERTKTATVNRQLAELKLADLQREVLTEAELDASWQMLADITKRIFLSMPDAAKHAIARVHAMCRGNRRV